MNSYLSRNYESEQDLLLMQNMLMEARARTNDWRYWHVGELQWNFFMAACHLDPREHIRLWQDRDGKLIGYALLGEDPSFDYQVLPEYEWSGIEIEAFIWAETRLYELRQQDAQQWGGNLIAGARQDDAKRIQFLEQHGFRHGGQSGSNFAGGSYTPGSYVEINFVRSLDEPIPEPILSSGFQVRCLYPDTGEISERAAAQREVWHPWTVGNVSDEDYEYFMQLPGYHRELDVVAVSPNGTIASYVNGWIDPVNRIGDFGPVGARAAYRRRGLTRAVLLECMRRMKSYGMDRICVSTDEENAPAIQLYESVGFKAVNKYLEYLKPD